MLCMLTVTAIPVPAHAGDYTSTPLCCGKHICIRHSCLPNLLLAGEVIRQLAVLHREAGFGEEIQPCIAAGGLEALVRVAVTGWPADGNLDTSSHPYDAVLDCGDGPCTLPGIEPEPGEEQ